MRVGKWGLIGGLLVLTGCAAPLGEPPGELALPDEAVVYLSGPLETFDRIVSTLEKNGYETQVVDRRSGFIQTRPKTLELGDSKGIRYKGFYVIRVGPRRGGSFALVRFAVVPELAEERKRLLEMLEQEGLR